MGLSLFQLSDIVCSRYGVIHDHNTISALCKYFVTKYLALVAKADPLMGAMAALESLKGGVVRSDHRESKA